jgi:menaquinone-9 beta-reductase
VSASGPVLVAGGGPAGSTLAILLARRGWTVELVDRAVFPRHKACGECLNPAGVQLLRRHGLLAPVLSSEPAWLSGWRLHGPDKPPARGRFARKDRALGIQRGHFDTALLQVARDAGVRVREGVRLTGLQSGNEGEPAVARLVTSDDREELCPFRFLVGADGLHSRVARLAGATQGVRTPKKASMSWRVRGHGPERGTGRLVLADGAVAGLAPVGGGSGDEWNATLVVDPARHPGVLPHHGWPTWRRLVVSVTADSRGCRGWSDGLERTDGPWSAGAFHQPVHRAARGRVLLVGDAAGYFDPLTGQGIHRALRSAELAAEVLCLHLHPGEVGDDGLASRDPAVLHAYDRALRREFGPGRWVQRGIEAVVSREVTRRGGLWLLRRSGTLTSALIRVTGDRPGSVLSWW